MNNQPSHTFLQSSGDIRSTHVYRKSVAILDITYYFADRYLSRGDRTWDQMRQAARSCKQNIVEGAEAGLTSKETEIKLTNVARASLGELLDDYEDYLRTHGLKHWDSDHPDMQRLSQYSRTHNDTADYTPYLERFSDEKIANLAINLIHQEQTMLEGLLRRQQERFVTEGGIREQMTRARLEYRNKQ